MLSAEELRRRYHALVARLRRIERRELREFRRWVEHTSNLLHLTVLVVVPLLIGLVTYLSNTLRMVSFLLFPPLASGTFTLFADPEGRYSSPVQFVGGMTLGALSGWVALEVAVLWGGAPSGPFQVHAGGAALAILLTGVLTWGLDLEEPTAFSTALLILLIGSSRLEYVLGVALSSTLVAAVFVVWRNRFYERRARYLYRSTRGDDNVLVPMRGRDPGNGGPADRDLGHDEGAATAMFAGRIAAAHAAGKVVLLDVVGDQAAAEAERAILSGHGHEGTVVERTATDGGTDSDARGRDREVRSRTGEADAGADEETDAGADDGEGDGGPAADPEQRAVAEAAIHLEHLAEEVEQEHGVPCEVVVAVGGEEGWTPGLVGRTVRETGCDLVVTPYEADEDGRLSAFVRGLLGGPTDVIVFRSNDGRREWRRAMVSIRRAGEVAHAMIDFARRVTGNRVSVCHCIARESERRRAETMLANLVDAFPGDFETRVSRSPVEEFLETNAPGYDLVMLGASTDRTAASRFLSPPTFRRLGDIDADVAIVHRAG